MLWGRCSVAAFVCIWSLPQLCSRRDTSSLKLSGLDPEVTVWICSLLPVFFPFVHSSAMLVCVCRSHGFGQSLCSFFCSRLKELKQFLGEAFSLAGLFFCVFLLRSSILPSRGRPCLPSIHGCCCRRLSLASHTSSKHLMMHSF